MLDLELALVKVYLPKSTTSLPQLQPRQLMLEPIAWVLLSLALLPSPMLQRLMRLILNN